MAQNYIYTIDVAHPPRHPDLVEDDLLKAWLFVRNHSNFHILKIIHGYGSSGIGGTTRETVRNWAFEKRKHLEAIIYGEDFSLTQPVTQEIISECGYLNDPDLDQSNAGITLLWID